MWCAGLGPNERIVKLFRLVRISSVCLFFHISNIFATYCPDIKHMQATN